MNNQLQKVLQLAKKTGSRVIVFDPENPDNSYVLMSVEEFEKMTDGPNERIDSPGLTESDLIDKINRDISEWKNGEESVQTSGEFWDISAPTAKTGLNNNLNNKKRNWSIPNERKQAADEVIEEDRQYLETI